MSRALIRNEEIYREEDWSAFTRAHLDWHATAPPAGDGYALAEDAPADAIPADFDITEAEVTTGEGGEAVTVTRRTAVLNAERYSARIASEQAE